uniref:tRNA(His) guanylyltransferase n=1 Tax=Anthurium amnicola TaxID=1678845 RepID=A0A1D1XWU3_9ARAE
MAKSEYEYVREQERDDRLPMFNWIVVRIKGSDFRRFSEIHGFEKPNDERALSLMNSCVISVLEQFPDIVFAYGFSDEYSKILSLSISFFTSVYVMKWKMFFPMQELMHPPSFDGQVICYPGPGVKLVRDYLSLRQHHCHISNQKNTCLWILVKSGKTESEAESYLEGTKESEKNELLFQQFGINYNNLPLMFRKGSSVFRDKVEETVKLDDSGNPIKRIRKKIKVEHCDLTRKGFWKDWGHVQSI